jgi:nucleotide-binding universal stress UspA family protein
MDSTQSTQRHGRVVVGVDGSDGSLEALRWANRMATTLSTELELVTAYQWPPYIPGGVVYPVAEWAPDHEAAQMLDGAAHEIFGAEIPAWVSRRVSPGSTAKILLDRAVGARMLVVGSRGHGGFVGLLLGSVSAACAEHATCPVLVVHGAAPFAE